MNPLTAVHEQCITIVQARCYKGVDQLPHTGYFKIHYGMVSRASKSCKIKENVQMGQSNRDWSSSINSQLVKRTRTASHSHGSSQHVPDYWSSRSSAYTYKLLPYTNLSSYNILLKQMYGKIIFLIHWWFPLIIKICQFCHIWLDMMHMHFKMSLLSVCCWTVSPLHQMLRFRTINNWRHYLLRRICALSHYIRRMGCKEMNVTVCTTVI